MTNSPFKYLLLFGGSATLSFLVGYAMYSPGSEPGNAPLVYPTMKPSTPEPERSGNAEGGQGMVAASKLGAHWENKPLIELKYLISKWSLERPNQALEFLNELPEGSRKEQLLNVLFSTWATGSPREALSMATVTLTRPSFLQLQKDIVVQWAHRAPDEALGFCDTLSPKQYRDAIFNEISNAWVKDDLPDAMSYLESTPVPTRKIRLREDVIRQLAATNPEQAKDWIEQTFTGGDRKNALVQLMRDLSTVDIASAVEMAGTFPESPVKKEMMEILTREWAIQQPGAALNWIQTQVPDGKQGELFEIAMLNIATERPEMANELFSSLDPSLQSDIAPIVGNSLANTDPQKALVWADSLQDPHMRQKTLLEVVDTWALARPADALDYVLNTENAKDRAAMLDQIIEPVAERNPAHVADIIDRLPDGSLRDRAMVRSVESWFSEDPGRALEWLCDRPDDPACGKAVAALASAQAYMDPVFALNVLDFIQDKDQRDRRLRDVMSEILIRGHDRAGSAIENSTLSAEEKEMLVRFISDEQGSDEHE